MGSGASATIAEVDHLLDVLGRWDVGEGGAKLGNIRWALDDLKAAAPGAGTTALLDLAGEVEKVLDEFEALPDEGARVRARAAVVHAFAEIAPALRAGRFAGDAFDAALADLRADLGLPVPPPPPSPAEEPAAASPPALAAAMAVEDRPFQLLPDDADRELLGEYVTESLELIQRAEASLLTLETDPEDSESINTVFRAFHTIKGTSAFIGITVAAELAHKAETLLARVRDKEVRYGGVFADLALRSADTLKDLLNRLGPALAGANPPPPDGYHELLRLLADPIAVAEAAGRVPAPPPEASIPPMRMTDILLAEKKVDPVAMQAAADARGDDKVGVALIKAGVARAPDVADALRKQKKIDALRSSAVDASVRVRTDRLDKLIEMVGELVIAHAMVAQDPVVKTGGHFDLARKSSHMGKIVRELQDLSMAMRMVPLKTTFQKMARLARDVAQKTGKEIEFSCEGEDTEIDRNMVDAIGDPLVHMIRNAADHGIESPDRRVETGKPRSGKLHLAACHQGGSVVVTITDDGAGLDREKIARKAIQRGLIDTDKGLSDQDVFALLFRPGFSTAEKVTDVSGRGVGLDVVKRNVEAMRGRIDIRSELGRGTTFAIFLPLTLAITDGMLIRVGAQRYILPTSNIAKAFRPARGELSTVVGQGEMVAYQGAHIPLFRLGRLFEVGEAIDDPTCGLLLVIKDGIGHFALLADEILGQQQIVAKSLGEGVRRIPGVSGGAILGDGKVGLILDPQGLGHLARRGTLDDMDAVPFGADA